MSEHSGASQSQDVGEVKVWAAGHEKICEERYENILAEISALRTEQKESRRIFAKALGKEVRQRDSINKRVAAIELKIAYALGAMASAAFLGGALSSVVWYFMQKLLQ